MSSTSTISTYPLSATTALIKLSPAPTAISITPTPKYLAYLTEQENYIFLAMRFGAVCAALTRFDMTDSASKIGQFAVDFLGTGMFLTGLEHYLGETTLGDDLVSVKYCLSDLTEDLEAHLDPKMQSGFGGDLREVVKQCGLTYDPSEVPEVVEMEETIVVEDEEEGFTDAEGEDDDDYED